MTKKNVTKLNNKKKKVGYTDEVGLTRLDPQMEWVNPT